MTATMACVGEDDHTKTMEDMKHTHTTGNVWKVFNASM